MPTKPKRWKVKVERLISQQGTVVVQASDGEEAVEKVEKLISKTDGKITEWAIWEGPVPEESAVYTVPDSTPLPSTEKDTDLVQKTKFVICCPFCASSEIGNKEKEGKSCVQCSECKHDFVVNYA